MFNNKIKALSLALAFICLAFGSIPSAIKAQDQNKISEIQTEQLREIAITSLSTGVRQFWLKHTGQIEQDQIANFTNPYSFLTTAPAENVNVTGDGLTAHQAEPYIIYADSAVVVIGNNDLRIIGKNNQGREVFGQGLNFSFDGGKSYPEKWFTLDPRTVDPGFIGASDPGVIKDNQGNIWVSWLAIGLSKKNFLRLPNTALVLSQIDPFSLRVKRQIVVEKEIDTNFLMDKPLPVVGPEGISLMYVRINFDLKNLSVNPGEALITETGIRKSRIADSALNGANGLFPIRTNGGLAVVWLELQAKGFNVSASIKFDSRPFGGNWGKDIKIADIKSNYNGSFKAKPKLRILPIPSLAVNDRGEFFATWPEFDSAKKELDIVLSRSADGASWTKPEKLGVPGQGDQFFPWIKTFENKIAILYETRANDPENLLFETAIAVSNDGGKTWTETFLSAGKSDPRLDGLGLKTQSVGDYISFDFDKDGTLFAAFPGTFDASVQPQGLDVFSVTIPNFFR